MDPWGLTPMTSRATNEHVFGGAVGGGLYGESSVSGPAKTITDAVRRQLWWLAGRRCAFPDCEQELIEESKAGALVYVGHECHIVAQQDDPRVARSPSSLDPDETLAFQHLIDNRHAVTNLVLLCQTHSRLIDHPEAGYTVADIVDIKAAHEAAVRRDNARKRSDRFDQAPPIATPVIMFSDPRAWEHKSLTALAAANADELAWLVERIGDPSTPAAVAALVDEFPAQLVTGSRELIVAVTRAAERHGLWKRSAAMSLCAAETAEGRDRADLLARAAIACETAGDQELHDRYLEQALAADPIALRAVLDSVDQDAPVDQLLASLLAIEPHPDEPPELVAQLKLHLARASMLNDDLPHAEDYLKQAEELGADDLATRATAVNVAIQRGRVGIRDDRDVDASDLRGAVDEALELRDTFVGMRRLAESARMLMLAADAWTILRDTDRARKVLSLALDDEVTAPDGREVLGDGALRAGQPDLALRWATDGETDGCRRILATARADMQLDRAAALDELEAMAAGGGRESVMAAAARLGACMPPINAPFSEPAAAVLEASHHPRMAVGIRVLTLASTGHHVQAEKLLDELEDTTWASELRLRAAGVRGVTSVLRAAADNLLQHGPDPSGRLLAARALVRTGETGRATGELRTVAGQQSAPPVLRSDAYAALLRLYAEGDDWPKAITTYTEWVEWSARDGDGIRDPRISSWQVRIAHHGGYRSAG